MEIKAPVLIFSAVRMIGQMPVDLRSPWTFLVLLRGSPLAGTVAIREVFFKLVGEPLSTAFLARFIDWLWFLGLPAPLCFSISAMPMIYRNFNRYKFRTTLRVSAGLAILISQPEPQLIEKLKLKIRTKVQSWSTARTKDELTAQSSGLIRQPA